MSPKLKKSAGDLKFEENKYNFILNSLYVYHRFYCFYLFLCPCKILSWVLKKIFVFTDFIILS